MKISLDILRHNLRRTSVRLSERRLVAGKAEFMALISTFCSTRELSEPKLYSNNTRTFPVPNIARLSTMLPTSAKRFMSLLNPLYSQRKLLYTCRERLILRKSTCSEHGDGSPKQDSSSPPCTEVPLHCASSCTASDMLCGTAGIAPSPHS